MRIDWFYLCISSCVFCENARMWYNFAGNIALLHMRLVGMAQSIRQIRSTSLQKCNLKRWTFTLSYINMHIHMHIVLSYMIVCILPFLQIVVLLLLTIFCYFWHRSMKFSLYSLFFLYYQCNLHFFYWAEILWPWIMLSGFDIGLLISFKWWLHYRDGFLFMCMFACRRVVLRNER